jgi:class 3 adenylate cyclase/tetratricopeptide (TPR) repeat protein
MTFDDLLSQILALLQHEKRISYRALKRRFNLADDDLEDLKEELIYAKQWAMDEDGRVLVWIGAPALASPPGAAEQARSPLAYTPKHLAEKILTTRSALEGERKQVTVLFADVAGFSTLSARLDPEDVHTIMDGCFAILTQQVHRYEGTINQYTGDGIMALFGAPITHEDHAVRACYAALGIQTALRDYGEAVQRRWDVSFQMRIGLNTGLVVVGRIGDDLRMDYTAQGDTVNRAAHLQQLAPPGTIWVAEATYGPAGAAFAWQALGPLPVKGTTDPVAVYILGGRHVSRSRFDAVTRRGLTRFVGRDLELERLQDAWMQAQQGHGQVVSVVGEAGLGKSRLLYEFTQQLAQQQARYIEGTCFTYGDSIAYLPFLEIVRALCALEEGEPEADAKRRIKGHLATLELEASIIASSLHHLLSFTVDDPLFLQLPPELVRQRTVEALTTLVMTEARHRPLVVILEDLHWIDKATEEVVSTLVTAMTAVPLLLVLVYRPESLHAWADKAHHAQIVLSRLPSASRVAMVHAVLTKPYASQMTLEPLSPAHSTALTQDILGTATLPPEFEELIVTKSDGNPLFVEELTRSLVESGVLRPANVEYVLTTSAQALELPTTVQGVLLARIDRLPEDLKEVLQGASAIGRVFGYPLLAQVLQDGMSLEQRLHHLEALEFIYPTSLAPPQEYSFKHVLTQEAVYGTLLRPKRAAYHARIGQALETLYLDRLEECYELLAYHYTRSPDTDKAVHYLGLANQKAIKANAVEAAYASFTEAMQLLDSLPDILDHRQQRIALVVNQAEVFVLLLKLEEYYDLLTRYESMVVELEDPGLLGTFYARLGWLQGIFGFFAQGIQVMTKAAALCEAAGNAEDAGLTYSMMQWCHVCTGDFDQVLALHAPLLRTMEQRFHIRWYAWGLAAVSAAYTGLGRWEKAVEEAQKALRVGEEFSDGTAMSFAAWGISMAYLHQGDLVRAVEYGELAVQQARTLADKVWAQCVLAGARCRAGELHQGLETLAANVPMSRAARIVEAEVINKFLGEGYWLAGEYAQATQALQELREIAERCGMRYLLGFTHRLLGEIALHTNPTQVEAPLAAPHFEQSIALLRAIHAENELALAYAGYGKLQKQQRHITQARDYLTRALETFERLGTLGEPDKVRQALAALPGGEQRG